MSYQFNREWLVKKFQEIERRILLVVEQLSEEELNWKPNEQSHSITNLVLHIEGNIKERIAKGILKQNIVRDREAEFSAVFISKAELTTRVKENFKSLTDIVSKLTDRELEQTQLVRNKERTNIDMLHQCAAHYSEHMGQIFYIAKLCLNEDYKSTSI
ncbi:DinB family protein [Paenibacillus polygoni]|uniref:DinB family protein n=1 Tax=Paenibacillus polygoni TaxID=3050112 RepID=A0ABY8X453_9BACL|nr:DinB family protein [Paenibacillus polygoni]WIV20317.1 DinB family protein [Paenibacillus polygoni]